MQRNVGLEGMDSSRKSRRGRKSSYDQILVAAGECFRENGVGETSIADIANRAGVSRQAVYKNLKSKDEIIWQIQLRHSTEVWARILRKLDLGQEPAQAFLQCFYLMSRYSVSGWGRILFDRRNRSFMSRIAQENNIFDHAAKLLWQPIISEVSRRYTMRVSMEDALRHIEMIVVGFMVLQDARARMGVAAESTAQFIFESVPAEVQKSSRRVRKSIGSSPDPAAA